MGAAGALPSALWIAVLVAAAGCHRTLWGIPAYSREVGVGASTKWATPASIQEPNTYYHLSLDWVGDNGAKNGLAIDMNGEGEILGRGHVAANVGFMLAGLSYLDRNQPYAILEPAVGLYSWSESAEPMGLFGRLGLGVGWFFRDNSLLEFRYDWAILWRVDGEEDARLQQFVVAWSWPIQ